ncbi:VOC family protein (plasmid) [Cupriavidus sp. P-10]|uniref:VOC family protein n=2 Tax=unclassified Cupriavidus TaxID=2640874 RepID=UPI000E2F38EB|nr:VOC family protein [Cupriavidus sp. P-10]BDB29873.1 VOC family protein [Cupriavidus sp. P-10]
MEVTGMNHFTVLTTNLESSVQFYAQILGLSVGARPGLSLAGAWLYCNGAPIVHLISSETSASPFGVLDHMAFSARDLPGFQQRLQSLGIPFSLSQQTDTGIWQLFFRDPDGAKIELDFAPSEMTE